MRGTAAIIGAGSVTTLLGIIFHLQGQSLIGPESSFMYSNPDWMEYGIQTAVAGAVLLAAGIVLRISSR